MVNRQLDLEYVVIGLLGTALILGGVFGAGLYLSSFKVDSLRQDVRELEVNQRSQLLTLELAESREARNCRALGKWINSTVEDKRDLRLKVADYEESRKIRNPEYRNLKRRYLNLLVQNMLEVRKIEDSCDRNFTEIIYFYSNENCPGCEDQGTVLTHHRRNSGQNIVVYPLDTDFDLENIRYLENYYNVTRYPALVIDGEKYQGFQSEERLENLTGEG